VIPPPAKHTLQFNFATACFGYSAIILSTPMPVKARLLPRAAFLYYLVVLLVLSVT
jgi:hypothetical protein